MKTISKKRNPKKSESTNSKPFFNLSEKSGESKFFDQNNANSFFTVQPKLTIGQPNDKFEQEADAIADLVVNESKTPGSVETVNQKIQTKCADCEEEKAQAKFEISRQEEEEEELQMQAQEEEEEELQMKKNGNQKTTAPAGFEFKLKSSAGAGKPLSKNIKQEMESGFEADFSRVRIHNDSKAKKLSSEINAQAFAYGNNIYFNEGKYNPESTAGKHLLAHELTHTVQQEKSKLKPKIQRDILSNRSLPAHTPFTPDQTAAFTQLIQTYLDSRSNENGRAAVSAIAAALEQAGEVQYNRPELTNNSPQFNLRPGITASQTLGSNNNTAGYTFPINGRLKVEIYPRAFIGSDVNNSLGFLTGVIIHEYIHVMQNLAGPGGSEIQREFQAWLWQAENIADLGISTGTEAARQIAVKLRDYFGRLSNSERTRRIQRRFNQAIEALAPPQQPNAPEINQQGEEEEQQLQPKEIEIQKSSSPPEFESRLKSSLSQGDPLPKEIKQEMEAGFGADFSKVSIHRDAEAENLSSVIHAQAFTHGKDIYFNKGKYNPETTAGKHLLAHELTHTIHQTG